jgi:organic radical activating enzyme
MAKLSIDSIEFYITHVCNLTCTHCRTFNNYNLKGHFKFNLDQIQPWAEKVDFKHLEILGGEPTINPYLKDWMRGLSQLWPDSKRCLTTNGTYLSKTKNLKSMLLDYNFSLKISIHSYNVLDCVITEIFNTFGDCEVQTNLSSIHNQIKLLTQEGITIYIQYYNHFQETPFQNNKFYNSDPDIAHRNCNIRGATHFFEGKIYKCGMLVSGPTMLETLDFEANSLLNSYKPLTVDQLPDTSEEYNKLMLETSIPQCALCSEPNNTVRLDSLLKSART